MTKSVDEEWYMVGAGRGAFNFRNLSYVRERKQNSREKETCLCSMPSTSTPTITHIKEVTLKGRLYKDLDSPTPIASFWGMALPRTYARYKMVLPAEGSNQRRG